ncbi:hypothetical protein PVAND_011672 [Polypedilum vanderplanki]|uniref:Protein with SprT-like domain at the N terminus n=1 Tax=Polypedilum vanderplanki TaxID=319348 RepID=A0A9J6CJB9_POLVA|nr:hypothetical protein PVAND_011672 [Polypedilum vanderplanki]
MSCVIRLSEPLLKLRSRKELIETLLHEMIHAWNFIRGIHEENGGHGAQFLSKMNEINRLAGTNITVYHTFHDEVELYKTHWWRCDGPCQNRKPFYGFVKRTSNRAPSKNDFWWQQHLTTCGGNFIKVKEPEKKPKKKAEPKKLTSKSISTKKSVEPSKSEDIRKFFSPGSKANGGSNASSSDSSFDESMILNNIKKKQLESQQNGNKVGGSGSGRSRLLDIFNDNNSSKKRKLNHTDDKNVIPTVSLVSPPHPPVQPIRKSIINQIRDEFDDSDDIIFIDDEFDDTIAMPSPSNVLVKMNDEEFCNCPICNKKVKTILINQHLDECLTLEYLK